jgi:hypothetical protein
VAQAINRKYDGSAAPTLKTGIYSFHLLIPAPLRDTRGGSTGAGRSSRSAWKREDTAEAKRKVWSPYRGAIYPYVRPPAVRRDQATEEEIQASPTAEHQLPRDTATVQSIAAAIFYAKVRLSAHARQLGKDHLA